MQRDSEVNPAVFSAEAAPTKRDHASRIRAAGSQPGRCVPMQLAVNQRLLSGLALMKRICPEPSISFTGNRLLYGNKEKGIRLMIM